MELRSLLPLIDDPDWRSPAPPSGDAHPEYLVVVARSDPKLFEYLTRRVAGVPHTEVRLDRPESRVRAVVVRRRGRSARA